MCLSSLPCLEGGGGLLRSDVSPWDGSLPACPALICGRGWGGAAIEGFVRSPPTSIDGRNPRPRSRSLLHRSLPPIHPDAVPSPVWMDSSTTAQCREVEAALGGPLALARMTGCRAHERCTGPQIRKMFQTRRELYDGTERISLVSSFMASLLIGGYACTYQSDGAGMNLMDIDTRQLRQDALEATAPDLEVKIGKLAPAHAIAGVLAPYFVQRFQFPSNCLVVQWSGDNPNSLAGLTLSNPGDLAISLGTSDTVFGITDVPEPSLDGNILPNPVDPNTYMVMLCYKNGSLTREDIRDRYAEKSWDVFNNLLEQTDPLNGGKLGFYYKEHEILPPLPGYYQACISFPIHSLCHCSHPRTTSILAPTTSWSVRLPSLTSSRRSWSGCCCPRCLGCRMSLHSSWPGSCLG